MILDAIGCSLLADLYFTLGKKQYGGVIKYKGILGENCLLISDPKALHHISSRRQYHYSIPNISQIH